MFSLKVKLLYLNSCLVSILLYQDTFFTQKRVSLPPLSSFPLPYKDLCWLFIAYQIKSSIFCGAHKSLCSQSLTYHSDINFPHHFPTHLITPSPTAHQGAQSFQGLPSMLRECYSPRTSTCSAIQNFSKPHNLEIFTEVSSRRHEFHLQPFCLLKRTGAELKIPSFRPWLRLSGK